MSSLTDPGYQPYGKKYTPPGTYDIVHTPDPFFSAGQSVEYAPGYRAYQYDPVVVYGQYSDASLEQARRQSLLNPGDALNMQMMLASAGYMSKDDVDGLWGEKVKDAYAKAMTDANSQYMSLSDFLAVKGGYKNARDARSRSGGAGGPRTSVQVNKSVRLTSRASAQALLKQTLAAELGREPTSDEIARFVSALNKDERANPTVSTTTVHSNGSNTSSSTVTKESSIDPGAEAETYAETVSPDEAHRYQSGNYYNLIARMVGGQ